MADREKVIKGLEILMNGCEYIHCDDCCFYISTKPTRCGLREEQIQEDALALLKEQDAVEPFHKCIGKHFSLIEDRNYDYCPYCGKPILWEGR